MFFVNLVEAIKKNEKETSSKIRMYHKYAFLQRLKVVTKDKCGNMKLINYKQNISDLLPLGIH